MRVLQYVNAAALLLATALATPSFAEMRTVPTILDFISLWLHSEYQLERPRSHPYIVSKSAEELITRRYGESIEFDPGEIVALYDAEARTILVSEDWMGNSVAELSILVHEMVHHFQAEAGTVFACAAERERLAYRAQQDWLSLFGQDLQDSFGIDPALIRVATVCTH